MKTLKESILDKDFDIDDDSLLINILNDAAIADSKNNFTYEVEHNHQQKYIHIKPTRSSGTLYFDLKKLYEGLQEVGVGGVTFDYCSDLWFFLMEKKSVFKKFTIRCAVQNTYFCDESGYNGTFEFENCNIESVNRVIVQECTLFLKKKSILSCSKTSSFDGLIVKDGSSKVIKNGISV